MGVEMILNKMKELEKLQAKISELRLQRPRTFDSERRLERLINKEAALYEHPDVVKFLDEQNKGIR